ncbi:hypothetical protein [Burkholderia sp. S-53]|uniref:hypothetical protein n=1 Tax=Burkholderia sp. S-53 TaxID=2906514 RepID=UPI0021D0D7E2|nr:hypothetical protein [Burkholderia sp. S-53]UXU85337.1 hypothetical protein LXM88_02940 [Burkholderia sp. S-53]
MSNLEHIHERFHTPSDEVASREVAAMSDEEQARAKSAATVHVRNWLAILLMPLAFGPWVPMFAYMLSILAYRGMFDPTFDIDRAVVQAAVPAIWATALFIAAWIGLNWCIATYGTRQRYWREMPFERRVELERHTLSSAIVVWSDDYDPEPLYVEEWIDGKLKSSRAGVYQVHDLLPKFRCIGRSVFGHDPYLLLVRIDRVHESGSSPPRYFNGLLIRLRALVVFPSFSTAPARCRQRPTALAVGGSR